MPLDDHIRAYMHEYQCGQTVLAQQIGVNQPDISKILNKHKVSDSVYRRVAAFFGEVPLVPPPPAIPGPRQSPPDADALYELLEAQQLYALAAARLDRAIACFNRRET